MIMRIEEPAPDARTTNRTEPRTYIYEAKYLTRPFRSQMQIEALDVPITVDDNGVLRLGGTRVTLDVVVAAFEQGCTPEEIAQDYPTLHLADVYAALTYYLQHRDRILAYLDERRDDAEDVRTQVEERREMTGLRERLRARRQA